MKTVILALLVLLVVNQNEGLRCYCGGNNICLNHIETCPDSANICGSIIIYAGPKPSHYTRCMSSSDCAAMTYRGISKCYGCGTDLCNI
uniref:UPAR/Ly6 domain-containing protein n=1 Tax=Anabas testudineus TaxID=64144 RepID=A0A7N6BMH1_ANATE